MVLQEFPRPLGDGGSLGDNGVFQGLDRFTTKPYPVQKSRRLACSRAQGSLFFNCVIRCSKYEKRIAQQPDVLYKLHININV